LQGYVLTLRQQQHQLTPLVVLQAGPRGNFFAAAQAAFAQAGLGVDAADADTGGDRLRHGRIS
jgi:hypothetical protein